MILKFKHVTVLLLFLSLSVRSQTVPVLQKEALLAKYRAVEEDHQTADTTLVMIKLSRPLTAAETDRIKPLRIFSPDHLVIRKKMRNILPGVIVSETKINSLWKASDQLAALWEQHHTEDKKFSIRI
ncbi:MAG TPA: hypothetical protein VGC08_07640, partial [Pedobacter sp.]